MMGPTKVNKPHHRRLRAIKMWQAHICGESGEDGEPDMMIGLTFFDEKDVAFADTHMTLAGACDLLDTLAEVIAAYRQKSGAINN
jgi:hypothetical protein